MIFRSNSLNLRRKHTLATRQVRRGAPRHAEAGGVGVPGAARRREARDGLLGRVAGKEGSGWARARETLQAVSGALNAVGHGSQGGVEVVATSGILPLSPRRCRKTIFSVE